MPQVLGAFHGPKALSSTRPSALDKACSVELSAPMRRSGALRAAPMSQRRKNADIPPHDRVSLRLLEYWADDMTPLVLACVICAAILHASWNAVLRGGDDRLWSMTLMMVAVASVTAIAALFLPWPNPASWPYVIASALIHVGYNLSLVRTYRSGDLGQTYPISRGSSPVLVALGALIFAHETLDIVASIGIALVSAASSRSPSRARGFGPTFCLQRSPPAF